MKNEDIRWQQRHHNFNRALTLLREFVEHEQGKDILSHSPIVKEGIIHRFQFTFELSWKTLKDKMEYDGIKLDKIAPKIIFKQAFQSKYIDDVEIWLRMADDRNRMSHTYDYAAFDRVLTNIRNDYFSRLDELNDYLIAEQIQ